MTDIENLFTCGIGIITNPEQDGARVERIIKDGPAARSGELAYNDLITHVIEQDGVKQRVGLDQPGNIGGAMGTKMKLTGTRLKSLADSGEMASTTFETDWITRDLIVVNPNEKNPKYTAAESNDCPALSHLSPTQTPTMSNSPAREVT